MAELEEITETPRTDIDSDPSSGEGDLARSNGAKRRRPKKPRNLSRSKSPVQSCPSDEGFEEIWKESLRQPANSLKQEEMPTQEDHQAQFYEGYRKVAEGYDKAFLKKYDEDLNTTLIFAGLFSAVTSAFIIQFDSQLQPDSGDETAALLRLILYKMDNTTFGNNVPTLPQWTGPPHTIVEVQAILFASLAVSLLSAFLAMFGKQWLNHYESTGMRESAIERSRSRQRKLGGMVEWYFNHVMQSLPLMLQSALLLLGCAISRYLWDIDLTIASVTASVTLFGAVFYIFIVIAGTVFESCPYQTPAAHLYRYILHYLRSRFLPTLRSASPTISVVVSSKLSRFYHASRCCHSLLTWWSAMRPPWYSMSNIANTLLFPPKLLIALPHDVYYLGRAIVKSLVAFNKKWFHRLMGSHRTTYLSFTDISPRTPNPSHQPVIMDLRCISWILQTSMDKAVHLLAFKYLISIQDLAQLHPTLVVHCFNIFIGCFKITNGRVAVTQGLEDLAPVSAGGFFRTLRHLATMDPSSRGLARLQRRYKEVFPFEVDFTGLPFQSTMTEIHALAGRFGSPRDIRWHHSQMSIQQYTPFAQSMVRAAREKYQQGKVPRWILRPALYLLSLGPMSQASVVADCLTIVAIDLGCDVSTIVISDESARTEHVSNLIIQKLKTWVQAGDSDSIISKRKAINTLFPYAIFLEQGGQQVMINAVLHTARAANLKPSNCGKFMWHHVVRYISRLFEERSPNSLDRVITLIAPYVPWGGALNKKTAVARWATAASTIPYTEEVGQNVIDALFQIAFVDLLRSRIPIHMWGWMKRRPPLPPMYQGLLEGPRSTTVAYVRGLGNIDLLKSYFFLIWTEKSTLLSGRIHEVESSIKEDFGGRGMEDHRKDLMERLDHVLEQLGGWSPEDPYSVRETRTQYTRLRDLLLEVDKR